MELSSSWCLFRRRRRCAFIRFPPPPLGCALTTLACMAFPAIAGSPLFLLKSRMQAFSRFNPAGAQYEYRSTFGGLAAIVRAEGPKGLLRGMDAAVLRTAIGSSAQLPAYNLAKTTLKGWGVGDGLPQYLLASMFSGACVCAAMQPADTALTRM